jgi:hypothetical protein
MQLKAEEETQRRKDAKGTEKNRTSGFNFAPLRLAFESGFPPAQE